MDSKGYGKYLVRVSCMTYNHASYIKDALDGFVMQQTRFPYVCMIVDDASTDGEPDVIRHYLKDNFDLQDTTVAYKRAEEYGHVVFSRHKTNQNCYFAVVLLNENHYGRNKSKDPYLSEWFDTKYLAICEGDDYWTHPLKLQKQVDYMEAHPNCTLTVHAATWKEGDTCYPNGCQESTSRDYSVEEMIRNGGLYFATASFVMKNEIRLETPEWCRKAGVGDFPRQILAGLRGTVHYLPDNMCVYRYMHEGSWSSQLSRQERFVAFQKNKIEWMALLDEATGHQYEKAIYDHLFQHYYALFHLREISFWKYAKAAGKTTDKRYGRVIKDGVRIYLPFVYNVLSRKVETQS